MRRNNSSVPRGLAAQVIDQEVIVVGSKRIPAKKTDCVCREEPLEIRLETRPFCVTMRTPGNDAELIAGFLLAEGIIQSRNQILSIKPFPGNRDGNVIDVFLSPTVAVDFKKLTRHVFASSSCGLCGKTTIQSVHQKFKPIRSKLRVDGKMLLHLPDKLKSAQAVFQATGGLHAAGIFDSRGKPLVVREDVGRHNAVDKVLGHALLNKKLPLRNHILVVSGRASFEIVQKALAARIPIVAAVSAPSSLAVEFARQSGLTLLGFVRGLRMNLYTQPERVEFGIKKLVS